VAKLKDFKKVKEQWLSDPAVRERYDELKAEFQIAEEILKARSKAKVSQAELARRIGTKSTAISRIESPNYGRASITMLKKIAKALGCELQIRLVPKSR
jgi:ribosome-binding protein aMBF1 (putative translation factor)